MDSSLLIAAGASFITGVAGYIIVRFWIKPIIGYSATKRKIKHELDRYLAQNIDTATSNEKQKLKEDNPGLRNARRHIMKLTTCYSEEIPYWYRLLLDSRGQAPGEALGLFTHLSKIRDPDQIKDRINSARKKLGIK